MLRVRIAIAAVAAGIVAGALALLAGHAWLGGGDVAPPAHPRWAEAQWPFPMDQWGKGKAFRCEAADCGTVVDLYVRAKIGFCNCTTGVADDDELARLSDLDLMGGRTAVLEAGRPISVAWMKGRSRPYAVTQGAGATRSALSIAFNDHCDAVVATALVGHDRPAVVEPSVIEFLNGKTVLDWAKVTLGL
jgi:hypothetical protein